MAKMREEIVETAMRDWNKKHESDENWLRSRIKGAWNSGYHNAQQQAAECFKAIEREWYDKGFTDGRNNVKKQLFFALGDEVIADSGEAKFIVTHIGVHDVCGIDEEGSAYAYMLEEINGKTGKSYDVIFVPKVTDDVLESDSERKGEE